MRPRSSAVFAAYLAATYSQSGFRRIKETPPTLYGGVAAKRYQEEMRYVRSWSSRLKESMHTLNMAPLRYDPKISI